MPKVILPSSGFPILITGLHRYKDVGSSPQPRATLRATAASKYFRTQGVALLWLWHHSAFPLSYPASFLPPNVCGSREHFLTNFLQTNLYLRVSVPENPTCDTFFPSNFYLNCIPVREYTFMSSVL